MFFGSLNFLICSLSSKVVYFENKNTEGGKVEIDLCNAVYLEINQKINRYDTNKTTEWSERICMKSPLQKGT